MAIVNGIARFETLIDKLDKMDARFHLTGSQYFLGKGNDYDFFTEYSEEIVEQLRALGFNNISKKQYGDSNCVAVMRAFDFGNLQIDIQAVRDVELKLRVQEKFKKLNITRPSTEQWNLAFLLLT